MEREVQKEKKVLGGSVMERAGGNRQKERTLKTEGKEERKDRD